MESCYYPDYLGDAWPSTALKPTPTAPSAVASSYGGTNEFMDDLSYTTIIGFAEPLALLSRRSRAEADRRGSALDR